MPKSISKIPGGLSVRAELKLILENRTDGASGVEDAAFDLLRSLLDNSRYQRDKQILYVIKCLRGRFPAMANVRNLLDFVETQILRADPGNARRLLESYRSKIIESRKITVAATAGKIAKYRSIFTLSNSSVIRNSIIAAKRSGWTGEVRIVESRPGNEGAALAADLSGAGVDVTLAVDAAMPELVAMSKAVFFGADAVTRGYFVNKTGTGMAIDCALRYDKPVFVAADRSKFIASRKYRFIPDKNPSEEISSSGNRRLKIINSYFEKIIPKGRVRYICGGRLFDPSRIKNILKERF